MNMTVRSIFGTARVRRLVCAVVVCACTLGFSRFAWSRDFLWKVSTRSSVVFLVGSVHLLTQDFYPLSTALEQAFAESNLLVEEADLGELTAPQAQLQMLSRGMLPPGQTLEQVVSPATFEHVSKRATELGIPIEPLKRFRPWLLALTLAALEWQKAGFDADLGLDKHFYDLARKASKSVQGLETAEFQISLFDGIPPGQQEELLTSTLDELDTEISNVTKIAQAWKAGDVSAIEAVVLQDIRKDPGLYKRLIVDRNRTWLPKLEALFNRQGHAFIVVGAAHLVGPDGLLALLTAQGYRVEQM
jgi:uncharacterized protein YbaP (TraB family)